MLVNAYAVRRVHTEAAVSKPIRPASMQLSSAGKCMYFFDLCSNYSMLRKIELDHSELIRCFALTSEVGKVSTLYTGSFDCTARITQASPWAL